MITIEHHASAQVPPEHGTNNLILQIKDNINELLAKKLPKSEIIAKILPIAMNLIPSLTPDDVLKIVEEQAKTELDELGDRELLWRLVNDVTLFKDDLSEPCFFYEGESFRAPSKEVVARIKHKYYKLRDRMPAPSIVNEVFEILESKARFDKPQIKLFNRVGTHNGVIHYDMRDGRTVKITVEGWEFVPSFPLFRRFKHQQPQAEPISGGDPWQIFKYLAVPEEHQLLLMVYIVSLFIPEIAHPILAIYGDKGSAKSFISNAINRLIDPTLTEKVIKPKNERDLVQTLRQKYLTVLDNISIIDDRVSDLLCQVCTGTSISYRKLYTDDGENIAQFRHAVILNSILMPIVNADLMDRSIILKLSRIGDANRRPELDLVAELESARPAILGGIFDTIVKAITIYSTANVENLPRLADFAKWGYAISEALGKSGEQFLLDFSSNVERQNESVAQNNVFCQAIVNYMTNKTSEFHKVAVIHASLKNLIGADSKDKTFPKLPHNMRQHLSQLRPTLKEHGITFEYFDRQKDGVKLLLTKTATPATSGAPVEIIVQNDRKIVPIGEACESGEPAGEIPVFEFDEMFEVVNG